MKQLTFTRGWFNISSMLIIRLQRVGKKNQASFRIVLAEKYRAAKKKVIEILGHYNPRTKEFGIKDQERLHYWIAQHVEISPTLNNLLVDKGLLERAKIKAWKPKIKKETAKVLKTQEVKNDVPPTPSEQMTNDKAQLSIETPNPDA